MNIRASYRYQMQDHKKSIIYFYIIMFAVLTFLYASLGISISKADGSVSGGGFSGMDFSTAIFLFVAALSSYKETFGMLMQNGVSRKSMFVGRILTTISIAAIMAVLDNIILAVFKAMSSMISEKFICVNLYEMLFTTRIEQISGFQARVESFFLDFFLYIAVMAVGYFITNVFYRLDKTGKTLLAAGLPLGVFLIIPVVDSTITNGKIVATFFKFIDFALGLSKQLPYRAMISSTLALILFSGLSWLTVRRASVKE